MKRRLQSHVNLSQTSSAYSYQAMQLFFNQSLSEPSSIHATQRAQYGLIKERALNYVGIHTMLYGMFPLFCHIGLSGYRGPMQVRDPGSGLDVRGGFDEDRQSRPQN